MKTKTVAIKTYMVYPVCTECDTVLTDADRTEFTLMSYPPKAEYTCPGCKYKMVLEEEYWPHIEYRED